MLPRTARKAVSVAASSGAARGVFTRQCCGLPRQRGAVASLHPSARTRCGTGPSPFIPDGMVTSWLASGAWPGAVQSRKPQSARFAVNGAASSARRRRGVGRSCGRCGAGAVLSPPDAHAHRATATQSDAPRFAAPLCLKFSRA